MNNELITDELHIDMNEPFYRKPIMKQGDTARVLAIYLSRGGQLTNLTGDVVRCYFIKPDNHDGYLGTEASSDLANGKLVYNITSNMLAVVGTLQVELSIMNSSKVITTRVFHIEVEKTIRNDLAIESSSEYTALIQTETRINEELAALTKYDTRLVYLETNMMDKSGDTMTGPLRVNSNLNLGDTTTGSDSYMKSYYSSQDKTLNISRYKESGTDTDQYVVLKSGGEKVATEGHTHDWSKQQNFNDNIAVKKAIKGSNFITLFDFGKDAFTGSCAQVYYDATTKRLTFQRRDTETGAIATDLGIYVNDKKVEPGIGTMTIREGDTASQTIKEYYMGSDNYQVHVFDNFANGGSASFNADLILPPQFSSIEPITIHVQNFDNCKADSLFATVDVLCCTKGSDNRYTIGLQFKNVSTSNGKVYLNVSFVATH